MLFRLFQQGQGKSERRGSVAQHALVLEVDTSAQAHEQKAAFAE